MIRTESASLFIRCAGLLLLLTTACRAAPAAPTPTPTPPPTETPAPFPTWLPVPTLPPMGEEEAAAQVREAAAARGVDAETVRVTFTTDPHRMFVRYTTSIPVYEPAFRAQTTLAALSIARIGAGVRPPLDGGINISILPPDDTEEVGLMVVAIEGPSLAAWANGQLNDREFVTGWSIGTITRE